MRALVIADSRFVAESIQRSLRNDASLQVVGYVDGRRSCYDETAAVQPDAVVFDEMTDPRRLTLRIREARMAAPSAKLLVLGGSMQESWLAEVAGAGAHAALSKSLHLQGLSMLVREICSGTIYHAFAPAQPAGAEVARDIGLTPRESEILRLVAEGASNGAIATRLWVTEQTVKFHLSNVFRKLGVSNRTQASHYAHVHRLFEPADEPPTLPLSEAA